MRNLLLLAAVGCMFFSPARADSAHQSARLQSQAGSHFLSVFWEAAQSNHAFINAFSDSVKTLVADESGSLAIVESLANASHDQDKLSSVSFDQSGLLQ